MRVFVPRVMGKMHNEDLHNMFSSSNMVKVIKFKTMRWVGNVVCMGKMYTKF
jgi:hypothetical protein